MRFIGDPSFFRYIFEAMFLVERVQAMFVNLFRPIDLIFIRSWTHINGFNESLIVIGHIQMGNNNHN